MVDDVQTGKIQPPLYYVQTGREDEWRKGFIKQLAAKKQIIQKMGDELDKAGGNAQQIIGDSLRDTYGTSWTKQTTILEK